MTGDARHELVDAEAGGEDAPDDRPGADAEHHVEALEGVGREAVGEALQGAELEVDAGDAAAGEPIKSQPNVQIC